MHALYMDDAYLQEVETTVVDVKDEKFVVLEQTVFYPNGGGQPCDTGVLVRDGEEFPVVYVGKFDGRISHEVSRTGLQPGDKVVARIDWDRRFAHMRAHTASHVLAGVFHQEFGAKITGNQLAAGKIRIDFSLEHFDRDLLQSAVEKASRLLAEDHPVSIRYLPREEALKDPSMVKLAGALPPAVEELRIVTIGSPERLVDRQADGGTHVRSTKACGSLSLIKAENKGKSNRRVYVALD